MQIDANAAAASGFGQFGKEQTMVKGYCSAAVPFHRERKSNLAARAVTTGAFGSAHRSHQRSIRQTPMTARRLVLPAAVCSFATQPALTASRVDAPSLIARP
ncbi:hypothetical protein [Bradyrhizobium sp.]|uniref:hypothetical protein n=1 Tax=Bradyrhizobium sp. TaxID=376 RepID=UPI0025C40543|nr:hypothetical protein [Bradyrhizobium sp.]